MEATARSNQGPFLAAAVICEKILEERDGVKSAIRIVDRVTRTVVGPSPPEEMEPFDWDGALLIKLKSGWALRALLRLPLRLLIQGHCANFCLENRLLFCLYRYTASAPAARSALLNSSVVK